MSHTHACESCGRHYTCTAPLEPNHDGWPAVVCVTRMETDPRYQQCQSCRERDEEAATERRIESAWHR